jgi:hypothetical protein
MDAKQRTREDHIVLIGDDRFLLELISANLTTMPVCTLPLFHHNGAAPTPTITADASLIRLMVLALSCSTNEPVIALAQVGLTSLIGVVPLLIISDRPFVADPKRNIFHLSFPFYAVSLRRCIAALLGEPASVSSNALSSDSRSTQ